MTGLPETMRAVLLTGHGGLDKLEFRDDVPVPQPRPGEALVRVGACGMNNTDINTRIGWYSKAVSEGTTADGGADGFEGVDQQASTWERSGLTFPRIQGADVAGEVVALGDGGDPAMIGRRVLIDTWLRDWNDPLNLDKCGYFGSECDGGYAEFTKAPLANLHPIDSDLSDAELATFATAYVTAEHMLVRAAVGDGDAVLIPGASGGVGSALIQLVRRRGGVAIAMSSPSKTEQVRAIGAEAVIERAPEDLRQALVDAIGKKTVDVVADVVGGPLWPQFLDVLRLGGRYTCAGAIAGPIVELDLRTFYLKNLTLSGATIVPPGLFADLVGYIESGEIRPLLAATYPLEDLGAAQQAFLEKDHVGNIVMTP